MIDKERKKDLLDKFKAAVENETWTSFVKNATNDFEFVENIQWTAEEIAAIQARGQAPTVENEISPIVDRVNGQYNSQKTKLIYKGRNLDITEGATALDETHSNILTDLALHVQQQTGYEFEEGDMFDDGTKCGFGCLEVAIAFEKDLSPKINIKAENALNIFPDPHSKKYNWNEDAEYICRAKWVSYDKAKQLYPKHKDEIQTYINFNPIINDSQKMEKNNLIDTRLERIRLIEIWYKEYKQRQLALTPSHPDGVVDISDMKGRQLSGFKKTYPDYQIYEDPEIEMMVGILCGEVLIENKKSPYKHNLFPFVPFFVKRRKNGEPYSFVRLIKDANMEINKRRSKALHLLNTNQAVYEDGAVKDETELRKEMAKPDGNIKYRKGYAFEIQKNTELAQAQMNMQLESKVAISRISGIGEASLNRPSEVRSGIGLQRKQMQTDIIITHIFNNLRRTRLLIAELIHGLIKQYYTEEKVYFVLDDMKQVKHFMMTQDNISAIREGIYDYIVEEAPNITTLQEEQFAYLAELVKGLGLPPNIGVALLPIFIRLSQLRNKEEVAKLLEQLQQLPPERPKTSLNLVWSELYPEEKAQFAQMMGFPDLAEFELQLQHEPQHVIKAKTKAGTS